MNRLVLIATIWWALSSSVLAQGQDPIELELERLDGTMLSIAQFRGQWVVLNYWATWCAPCRKEIPDLSELHDRNDQVTVLGLAFEEVDTADLEAFLEEFPASYPILLLDVYAPPEPFGAPRALPTTIILDPEGKPEKTFIGPVTSEQIESFIQSGK